MIQNDKIALSNILRRLPVRDPLFNSNNNNDHYDDHYEPCLWVFFGRNNNNNNNDDSNNNINSYNNDLQGRPEHTDQISHDGTWHYQLSGTKRWLLRPTPTLLRQFKKEQQQQHQQKSSYTEEDNQNKNEQEQEQEEQEPKQIRIDCQEGDILIVNTRLWKHQTIIPSQIQPSVSYARDFWIRNSQISSNKHANNNNDNKEGTTKMTNVDGLYATDDVESDTIIFKENDMPDCELHTSSSTDVANCKVVELDDGHGTQAVVSSRYITAGEFFCIIEESESSSDDEDEDEDIDDNDDYDDDDDNDG